MPPRPHSSPPQTFGNTVALLEPHRKLIKKGVLEAGGGHLRYPSPAFDSHEAAVGLKARNSVHLCTWVCMGVYAGVLDWHAESRRGMFEKTHKRYKAWCFNDMLMLGYDKNAFGYHSW